MLPHQRTLLKLLDGYVHNQKIAIHTDYTRSIPQLYAGLITQTLASIRRSLVVEPTAPEQHLPGLGEGVVLAAQCSQALLLQESELPLKNRLTLKCMVSELGSIELTVGQSITVDSNKHPANIHVQKR